MFATEWRRLVPRLPAALSLSVVLVLSGGAPDAAAQAAFLTPSGTILYQEDGGTRSASRSVSPERKAAAVWGALSDGRVVATLKPDAGTSSEEGSDSSDHSHGNAGPLALLSRDGTVDEILITSDVLRAFLSSGRDAIAAVTPERRLFLWNASPSAGGSLKEVQIDGRVSHASWSPDGRRVAATVYPPDFSPEAVARARNNDEFLRLQNSDIYLIDAATGLVLSRLTSDPGTDTTPFFSPDGSQLYYHWLHERENRSGLMRLTLDRDNGTSASVPAEQLTQGGAEAGQVPLGRVGTYLFADSGRTLLFEAGVSGEPGAGEIWAMSPDGTTPRPLLRGRKPQLLSDGSVAVLAPSQDIRILSPREMAR